MKIKFDRISAGTPCYNGNISSLTWENAGYKQKRGYKFTYDNLNRMTNAVYGERDDLSDKAGHYNETLEYDTNGNIMRLQRRGLKQDGQHGNIDDLHLSYKGNQPMAIKEDAEPILYEGAFGLNEKGEHRLAFNGGGALQSDETRGIAMIEYDAGNNPQRIQFTNGNVTKYVYTPNGRKLRTIHHTAMPNIKVEVGQIHPLTAGEILSSDSIDYMMGGKLITKNGRIDKYLFEGGYCQAIGGQTHLTRPPLILWDDEDSNPSPSDYEQWRKTFESWEAAMKAEREKDQFLFYYYNRDHLGNIREVVDDNGNVVQVNNYYPFGSPYCDTSASKAPELQPYKYNGKELDLMHGLNTYNYGARQYNPVVPIWDRVDPLCEKYYNTSPYVYCGNNPVNAVDPDGMKIIPILYYNNIQSPKSYFHSPKAFYDAMCTFAKTTFGKQVLSDFTPRGSYIFGVKGNGRYANFDLRIQEVFLSNQQERAALFFNQYNHSWINAQTSFNVDSDGAPYFNIIIDISSSPEELLETITHEFTVHLTRYSEILDTYLKNNDYKEAQRAWKKISEDEEHHDLNNKHANKQFQSTKNYYITRDELIKMNPLLKGQFYKMQKEYEQNY